jgi:gamma-glutamyl-gamma-aminobutyrate hydrolase PuuD
MTIRPTVIAVTRRTVRKDKYIDYVGEFHLNLLIRLRLLPLMVPVVEGVLGCLPQYRREMAGLLLIEGEDVDPVRYRASRTDARYVESTHPLKDAIEIRLARYALREGLPILAICRGSQLVNVACGGTLYVDVQKQQRSDLKHVDHERYDTYRHPVTIVPDSPLEGWYRRKTINVNSYHHQGIRRLASRFKPMAYAADGLIEGYYDPNASFLVGLQFHPERMLNEYAGNWRVWKAFGAAVHGQFSRLDGRRQGSRDRKLSDTRKTR